MKSRPLLGQSVLDLGKDLEYMIPTFQPIYFNTENFPLIFTLSFHFSSVESINIVSIFETVVL